MALPMSFAKRREFCRKALKFLFPKVTFDKNICVQKRYKSYRKCDVNLKGNSQWSLQLEFGKMAKFADGAVVAQVGDTSVLVAVSCKTESSPTATFLPLIVDYRQKSAAAGRIPTNHLRRELGPTDKEILTSRVIDRSLRSLFPGDFFYETQITCNLLSVDGINDPDVISINAASAALSESDIPWNGPIGAVRVSCQGDKGFIVNPTRQQQEKSDMNLIIATDKQKNVVMLEGEMNEVPYGMFKSAIKFGAYNASMIAQQIEDVTSKGSSKRFYTPAASVPDELINAVHRIGSADIFAVLNNTEHDKISRDKALQNVRHKIVKELNEKFAGEDFSTLLLHEAVSIVIKQLFRYQIVNRKIRCDGRGHNDLRRITSSIDLFKPVHGSALFQRGQTQVLSTVTFDSLQASMKLDPISVLTGAMKEKNFMLHYEFPAYATNEVKSPGIKNRRELGHGALAEKGLRAVIPDDFPFSIRLTAEVLESNGSSSMASICCGSLALMDAGVPIKRAAAGIAIGLITEEKTDEKSDDTAVDDRQSWSPYHILSDILGIEDYMGDMDMKIGGTVKGVTAIQMDLKIPGIPVYVIEDSIGLARDKISTIIQIMNKSLSKPRESMKASGPVVEKMVVTPAKRGQFVGIGGMNLKKLTSQTGVTVSSLDESTYEIFAPNKDAMNEAKEMIENWLSTQREPQLEFGAVYAGKITEIREQGLLVQLHPAMEPVLLPNSQIDHRKISHPEVLGFKVGQMINVKYFGRDPTTGRIRLSRKVLSALPGRTIKFLKEEDA